MNMAAPSAQLKAFLKDPSSCLFWHLTKSRLIAIFALVFIFGFFIKGIYNTFFHRLRHVPGPFWAAFSDFYKVYLALCKHIPSATMELHKKYGSVVRIAPNLVSFDDPKMISDVYQKCVDKSTFYTPAVMGETPSMFWTLNHTDHALKKRLFGPSLSMKHIRDHEFAVNERISELVQTLRCKYARTQHAFDFAEWVRWVLNDIITHLTFSEPRGCVKAEADVDGLIQALHSMFMMTGLVAALPWLVAPLIKHQPLKRFLLPRPGDKSGSGKIMQQRDQLVSQRMRTQASHHPDDMLNTLLNVPPVDGSDDVSIEAIKAECLSFMIAASDTTAGLVSPLVGSVIARPEVYDKLNAEIVNFENAGKLSKPVASFDETNVMPYFNACFMETIRLLPPTPIILPRVVPSGGLLLGQTYLPEGTEVGTNPWIINRNPDVFGADAGVFRPERWLENDEKSKHMERFIFTFGFGARACIGKHLARFEAQKLCLQLLRDFHFRSVRPERPWQTNDRGISIYNGQWMQISERLS